MGMSEPGYGTDVLGMRTSGTLNGDGSWTLNGGKMWITNGAIDEDGTPADVCMVYARTGESDDGRPEITTFIVEKGMVGYSVGQKIVDKLGMRASNTAELVFDDVIIPPSNVVGSPGESMVHMMRNLEIERIALAAMAVGISRRCPLNHEFLCLRKGSFRKEDRDFGQIQRHIGESWAEYRAMRAYVYDTARNTNLSNGGQQTGQRWRETLFHHCCQEHSRQGYSGSRRLRLCGRIRRRTYVEGLQTSGDRRRHT